ncbi:MAG: hypothetical protein MI861_10870 [Pirellulales bacterium]|nr:hypothetical protein [Pirellulales bacterium]
MASVTSPDQEYDAAAPSSTQDERLEERAKLRISRFDVVTSFFMALILFIGTFVTILFIIWLTSRWSFPPQAIKPTIEEPAGRGENPEGFERDFEPPGAEEVEELMEPTLAETLEAVTDAVSTVAASMITTDSDSPASTQGSGAGDSRPPGPAGEGADIIPKAERWQLVFSSRNLRSYATQLDFYEIELAAIGPPIQGVDIANNLSTRPRQRRVVDTSEEKRLYFMWTSPSPLMQFDRQLLQQAGIQLPNRQMLKFIPEDLEGELEQKELAYARERGHNSVTEIAKTIFESKPVGSDFDFEVVDQRYRKPR